MKKKVLIKLGIRTVGLATIIHNWVCAGYGTGALLDVCAWKWFVGLECYIETSFRRNVNGLHTSEWIASARRFRWSRARPTSAIYFKQQRATRTERKPLLGLARKNLTRAVHYYVNCKHVCKLTLLQISIIFLLPDPARFFSLLIFLFYAKPQFSNRN